MSDVVEKLTKTLRRAEDGAGTLPAKEAVKLRPADWHAVTREAREAANEIARLRAELAAAKERALKFHAETRAFWDALVPKGPRCRDCADFDGRCQGDGPPCAPQDHALENLAKLKARALAAEAKAEGLAKALEPFAEVAASYDPDEGDGGNVAWAHDFTIGSLRQARTALAAYRADKDTP